MSTAIDAIADVGQLRELADPHLWLETVTDHGRFGQYSLSGILKPTDSIDADTPAWQVRARLLDRADRFVEALAAAGWQLMDSFTVEFRTEIANFMQTLNGVLVVPSEQKGVHAEVALRVGRAR